MHPAPSIIFFTATAGMGYGGLLLFALAFLAGHGDIEPWVALLMLGFSLAFVTAGLSSSVLHLRRPARAVYALSQWRSSWLSREGVLALATFVPAVLLFAGYAFDLGAAVRPVLLALMGAGSLATIISTSMIYASLKSIPAWHRPLVPVLFVLFALATGALMFAGLIGILGRAAVPLSWNALVLVIPAWGLKLLYWRNLDRDKGASSPQSATGLKGAVRPVFAPHTESNYLLDEMGFRVARKHGQKLRRLSLITGAALPVLLLALYIALAKVGWSIGLLPLLAWFAGYLGVLTERWLFFAEARHSVMHFYEGDAHHH